MRYLLTIFTMAWCGLAVAQNRQITAPTGSPLTNNMLPYPTSGFQLSSTAIQQSGRTNLLIPGYVTLGGTTNQISDDGSNLTRNGVAIGTGGGGDTLWHDVASDGTLTNSMETLVFGHDVAAGDDENIAIDFFSVVDAGTFNDYGNIYMVVSTNNAQLNVSTSVAGAESGVVRLISGNATAQITAEVDGGTRFLDVMRDTLLFESQAADNATNAALVVDTAASWGTDGGRLVELLNNGTNKLSVLNNGEIRIGPATLSFYSGAPFYAGYSTVAGDPLSAYMFLNSSDDSASPTNTASITLGPDLSTPGNPLALFDLSASTDGFNLSAANVTAMADPVGGSSIIIADVDGQLMTLRPETASTGSAVAYLMDTSNVLTNGDSLFAIRNSGNDRVKFDHAGTPNIYSTITAGGTTGAQTIDKPSGRVNIAAGQTSIVVTDALVTTSSLVFATVASNDATATLKNVVSGSGSFTVTLTAAATGETKINFFVVNPL